MKNVVIVSAKRSAIGSFGGSLKNLSAKDIALAVLNDVIQSINIDKNIIDEVILGNVLSAGLGQNIARQILLGAGIKKESTAFCINYLCGSGLKALELGYQSIALSNSDVVAAGGTESMSNAPYILNGARFGYKMGDNKIIDTMINDGLLCAINKYHMGITAENLAELYHISRAEQDEFALNSQLKAAKAQEQGKFIDEITPLEIVSKKGTTIFKDDEYIRKDVNKAALSALKAAFKKDGSVSAGNSSGINDGAALLLLMSEERAKQLGLKILAYIKGFGNAGVDASTMGIGPINAVKHVLHKTNLTLEQIDLIESNEAFSVQSLAVSKELGFDMNKVNVNGGAIALGHPIGASGARIVVTLIHEMKKRKSRYGLATLCVGGGQGIAVILEMKE